MNTLSRSSLCAALCLVACGEPGSDPVEDPDGGSDQEADAGELTELFPSTAEWTWGAPNLLGHGAYKPYGQTDVDYGDGAYCMEGPMQLTLTERDIREVRLSDADAEQLRAALETPSGEGFVGRDETFDTFYGALTTPHTMTVTHVHAVEAGTLSFRSPPSPTDLPCDAYVSRQVLGARYAVALAFAFTSPDALQDFRAENPGLDLEQILRGGSTSVDVATGPSGRGLLEISVVLARMGGDFAPDLPLVRARCDADDLRACARLLDELDAHARAYLASFETPTLENLGTFDEPGPWAPVRLELTELPALEP